MKPVHSSRPAPYGAIPRNAERLIAISRATLALTACGAVWADPLLPVRHPWLVWSLLTTYLLGALGTVALIEWHGDSLSARLLAFVIRGGYCLDVLIFGPIVFLDGGFSSSLFMVFTFTVATAAYRWHVRGALLTAAATTGALIIADGLAVFVWQDNRFADHGTLAVMRLGSQFVYALLLGHLGAAAAERRRRLFEVSAVRRSAVHDIHALLEESLRAATSALDATSAILVWEDPDEPWLVVAECEDDVVRVTHEPPSIYGTFTSTALYHYDFVAEDASAPITTLTTASLPSVMTDCAGAIHPELARRFNLRRVMCLRVRGDIIDARLLIQAARPLGAEDITLGRLVAGQIVATLDLHLMGRRLRDVAIVEERERISRELHDGMLQSLAGAALTLRRATQKLDTNPAEARTLLAAAERLLLDEQRELRGYLHELRFVADDDAPAAPLSERLRSLVKLLEAIWQVRITASVDSDMEILREQDIHELLRLAQESITNATRHGSASEVQVNVSRAAGRCHLAIKDNGKGFSFKGTYGMATLDEMRAGPLKLKERVKTLRGSMSISSGADGACIDITFPFIDTGDSHGDPPRHR